MEQHLYCDLIEMFCINASHHHTVSIICRDPKWQLQISAQPFLFPFGEAFYLPPFVCISKDCEEDDHDDVA